MNEATVELATRARLAALGYAVLHGPALAPGAVATHKCEHPPLCHNTNITGRA
jgi:hypothetical protein